MLFSRWRWLTSLSAVLMMMSVYVLLSSSPFESPATAELGNDNANAPAIFDAEPTPSPSPSPSPSPTAPAAFASSLTALHQQFADLPPSDGDFGLRGRRVQSLRELIEAAEARQDGSGEQVLVRVEKLLLAMFPWLKHPSREDLTPFRTLRASFVPGSKGLVIPVGKRQFRFAAHLISGLRNVLDSKLPIEIAFAGDRDLPKEYQDALVALGSSIELLDVTTVFEDKGQLKLAGSWAIKPFAMLASSFEEVILIDADAVFFQDPDVMFAAPGYQETGTLLFHDRLLWQNVFLDRARWWKQEIEIAGNQPSLALTKSLVATEGYSEEGDSGVILFNKSRLELVMALLHICWQNTVAVRDKFTYKITYGDKESYWFGLELSGVQYAFEEHYGSIAGHVHQDVDGSVLPKVCSFNIAHPDFNSSSGKMLWYNGSLLKNKMMDQEEFEVPHFWMMDGEWRKGAEKADISCMINGKPRPLGLDEIEVIERQVRLAKVVDVNHQDLIKHAWVN